MTVRCLCININIVKHLTEGAGGKLTEQISSKPQKSGDCRPLVCGKDRLFASFFSKRRKRILRWKGARTDSAGVDWRNRELEIPIDLGGDG